ncbi:outer membrane beta-barrel protein [Paraglaciecola sp.]|uniref:outer membrane beta-barrel protein n=1 Tax=Paraglaciecola sp. TaxID=1920173 RepID=UPI0030F4392D
MKYLISTIALAYFNIMPLVAEELQAQYFYGASLSQVDVLAIPKQSDVRAKYVPTLFVGFGYEFNLSNDWKVEWNNSLNFAQANITPIEISEPHDSALTNVGLWSHTTLKYTGLFENASPFVKIGVGLVNVDYSLDGQSKNTWDTATEVQAGIEFELSGGASISLAVGRPNYNKF